MTVESVHQMITQEGYRLLSLKVEPSPAPTICLVLEKDFKRILIEWQYGENRSDYNDDVEKLNDLLNRLKTY